LRWLLLLPALLALAGACFAARWYVGNTIAEYSPAVDEGGLDMARMAVRWAPGDPLTHWRLASFDEKTFSAENLSAAVREYELAVAAAPYDYRYWMELGRALEASGDRDQGEKALLRAVELAPAYSHPRWYYGNLLLRQGKTDEAFAQLARAAEADEVMQPAIFGIASQLFGNDVERITQVFKAPTVRLNFAIGFIKAGKFDEAMRVLRTISAADRKAQSELTEQVLQSLIAGKQFHSALTLMRELAPAGSDLPAADQLWNGGFEKAMPVLDKEPFRWVINNRPQAQVTIDPHAHTGNGSLQIKFKVPTKLDSVPVSQTVVVEPDSQFRLQFYQRTETLTSASTPAVVITDTVDNTALASSQPAPTGTNDWQLVTVDFKTKPLREGITIGFVRTDCDNKQPVCPIFGTVWYDDFNLQRLSGPGTPRRGANNSAR
jgi:Tfp pilus assembly protein PilF